MKHTSQNKIKTIQVQGIPRYPSQGNHRHTSQGNHRASKPRKEIQEAKSNKAVGMDKYEAFGFFQGTPNMGDPTLGKLEQC